MRGRAWHRALVLFVHGDIVESNDKARFLSALRERDLT
jgi:hypothetical protein